MSAGFTPGPWRLTGIGIIAGDGTIQGDVVVCGYSGRKEDFANARLIAAAPDLYSALRDLLAETELTYATQLMDRQDAARAALAKATGDHP